METKFIEATNGPAATPLNWGKFLLLKFGPCERAYPSATVPGFTILARHEWDHRDVFVMDLATGEGARFRPGYHDPRERRALIPSGDPDIDLNHRHAIRVCILYEPFLRWLHAQDCRDLANLPSHVHLADVPVALFGHRRGDGEVRHANVIEATARGLASMHPMGVGEIRAALQNARLCVSEHARGKSLRERLELLPHFQGVLVVTPEEFAAIEAAFGNGAR